MCYAVLTMKKADPNEPITRKMLSQAVDAILKGMDKMVGDLKGQMNLRFKAVDARFDKVEDRLGSLEMGQRYLKDDIRGLKEELSDTPSRREFEELKSRVNKHHPGTRSL